MGLTDKASNPKTVLKEVLDWTGGQPFLSQKLCQLVSTSESSIAIGEEAKKVEQIVRSHIIENWESQDNPEHLRTIRDRLLCSEQDTGRLLGLYQQILQRGEVPAAHSSEQMKLQLSGLVVKRNCKLRVYNRIYQTIFDQNWVDRVLANLRPYAEAIAAWLASDCQDQSWLLRGQALRDAQAWADDKSLSNQDYQFLGASEKQEVQLIHSDKIFNLGLLVAGVAHEINNPVNFISGILSYATEDVEDLLNLLKLYAKHYPQPVQEIQEKAEAIDLEFLIEDLPKALSSMKIGAERIRQVVLSLRNFSRSDEPHMNQVDLHEGIDNTLLILQNRLKSRGDYAGANILKEYGE